MCGQPDPIEDLGTISPRSYVDQVLRLGPEPHYMQTRLTTPDTRSDARPLSEITRFVDPRHVQFNPVTGHRRPADPGQHMQVKSFTYERAWYGTYYRQRFFSMERMDKHIAKMLSQGWKILTQTAHSGEGRGFRPFAKRDTITISFQRP